MDSGLFMKTIFYGTHTNVAVIIWSDLTVFLSSGRFFPDDVTSVSRNGVFFFPRQLNLCSRTGLLMQ